jgi:uncharacterized membrane protein YagU involved in acid resistance
LVATVPMTVAMELMHRRLPRRQRYPLPPRIITQRTTRAAGVEQELDEQEQVGLTLAAHFGYGAAAGALYPPLADRVPGPAVAKGVGYGLLVWTGSYLGLLPALGILTPATEHPARRNLLMIAAHVVWGAALGGTAELLGRRPLQSRRSAATVSSPSWRTTRRRATSSSPTARRWSPSSR